VSKKGVTPVIPLVLKLVPALPAEENVSEEDKGKKGGTSSSEKTGSESGSQDQPGTSRRMTRALRSEQKSEAQMVCLVRQNLRIISLSNFHYLNEAMCC